jgi:hypothetical protein
VGRGRRASCTGMGTCTMQWRGECTTGRTRPRTPQGELGAGAANRPRCPSVRSCGLVVWGTREARGTRFGQVGDFGPWDARSTIASRLTPLHSGY